MLNYYFLLHVHVAGNMNGIYKGKKYFDCPPGHGKMLHITSILAVMPRQVYIHCYTHQCIPVQIIHVHVHIRVISQLLSAHQVYI